MNKFSCSSFLIINELLECFALNEMQIRNTQECINFELIKNNPIITYRNVYGIIKPVASLN